MPSPSELKLLLSLYRQELLVGGVGALIEEVERRRGDLMRGDSAAEVVESFVPFPPFRAIKGRGWSRKD